MSKIEDQIKDVLNKADEKAIDLLREQKRQAWIDMMGGNIKEAGGHVCARRLVGRQKCVTYHTMCKSERFRSGCPGCDHIQRDGEGLWDHTSLWSKNGIPVALVMQPYYVSAKSEQWLSRYIREHKLAYMILPKENSWWNPGQCWVVVICRRDFIK